MTEKKAREILSHCEHMDALANNIKSYSAFVKAEMYAFLGGVEPPSGSEIMNQKSKLNKKLKFGHSSEENKKRLSVAAESLV